MTGLNIALITTCLILFLALTASFFPKPSNNALQVAQSIEKIIRKPGLHKIYTSCIIEFKKHEIIVECGRNSAKTYSNLSLIDGKATGLIKIYSDGRKAWFINP